MLGEVPASQRLDLEMRIARAEGAQRMCRLLVVRALKAEADLYRPNGLPHGVRAQRRGLTLQYFKINMKSADYPLTIAEWDTQKGRSLRAEMLRQPRQEPPEDQTRIRLTSLRVRPGALLSVFVWPAR